MKHPQIISALGGYRALAAEMDLHPTTTFKWTQTGIPPSRWLEIETLAKKKGKRGINLDVLARNRPKG